MKRLLFYLWLEIKKGMKFIPFFLAGILFTAAAVILAAAAFSAANGGEQVLPKATAAIVIDSDGSDETRTEAGQADLKTNLALGLVSGDDPELNFVQIPMETTQWGDGFTQDDYKALVADMFNGTITVSNDISAEEPAAETATVNFQGNLK